VISSLGKDPEREKVIDFSDADAPFFSGDYGDLRGQLHPVAYFRALEVYPVAALLYLLLAIAMRAILRGA
jgi:hypothetical protein